MTIPYNNQLRLGRLLLRCGDFVGHLEKHSGAVECWWLTTASPLERDACPVVAQKGYREADGALTIAAMSEDQE